MIENIEVRTEAIRRIADDVLSFEMRSPAGTELPRFEPGAHIDLHLPVGPRSYSLVNSHEERHRYVIAVHRNVAGRGGSRWLHEELRVGARVRISAPRNNFRLFEGEVGSIFLAGGIGVTPFLPMLARLNRLGREWTLRYCARSPETAAYVDRLLDLQAQAQGRGTVMVHYDGGLPERRLDVAAVVETAAADAHLYCCGPAPMLAAFEAACAGRDPFRIHVEHFNACAPRATTGGFRVELRRSGLLLDVPAGGTLADALLQAGVPVPFSCMEGVCGSCETRVLDGIPDHRDAVLSQAERAEGRTMMVCCSGAKSSRLVLDL